MGTASTGTIGQGTSSVTALVIIASVSGVIAPVMVRDAIDYGMSEAICDTNHR